MNDKPITAWGYVGYNLLFSIPLVGQILILVYSFGGTDNINLKNYARSYLCMLLISIIISIVTAIVMLFITLAGIDLLSQFGQMA